MGEGQDPGGFGTSSSDFGNSGGGFGTGGFDQGGIGSNNIGPDLSQNNFGAGFGSNGFNNGFGNNGLSPFGNRRNQSSNGPTTPAGIIVSIVVFVIALIIFLVIASHMMSSDNGYPDQNQNFPDVTFSTP